MWDINYVDENLTEECKTQFRKIYPEYSCIILGASQDRMACLAEVEFPDGTFYFRLTPNSVSSAYNTLEEADKVWENENPIVK